MTKKLCPMSHNPEYNFGVNFWSSNSLKPDGLTTWKNLKFSFVHSSLEHLVSSTVPSIEYIQRMTFLLNIKKFSHKGRLLTQLKLTYHFAISQLILFILDWNAAFWRKKKYCECFFFLLFLMVLLQCNWWEWLHSLICFILTISLGFSE